MITKRKHAKWLQGNQRVWLPPSLYLSRSLSFTARDRYLRKSVASFACVISLEMAWKCDASNHTKLKISRLLPVARQISCNRVCIPKNSMFLYRKSVQSQTFDESIENEMQHGCLIEKLACGGGQRAAKRCIYSTDVCVGNACISDSNAPFIISPEKCGISSLAFESTGRLGFGVNIWMFCGGVSNISSWPQL